MIAQLSPEYIKIRPGKALTRLISHFAFEGRPLTTRARWLNNITRPVLWANMYLPWGETTDPIFILGTGRSGTTILGTLLSIHHQIGFLNEPKILWNLVYPYEDLIGSYSTGPARYCLSYEDVTPVIKTHIHRLYSMYRSVTGSQRVLDKYPEMIFRSDFLRSLFPKVKFLVIIRNGWDTVQSIDTWSRQSVQKVRNEVHDWWGVDKRKWHFLVEEVARYDSLLGPHSNDVAKFTDHVDMAAVEWILSMRAGMHVLQTFPNESLLIKYEDLVVAPGETMHKIMRFCDLEQDEKCIQYARNTVRLRPLKSATQLHASIADAFASTMHDLGYQA